MASTGFLYLLAVATVNVQHFPLARPEFLGDPSDGARGRVEAAGVLPSGESLR